MLFSDAEPVLVAELWSPVTQTYAPMAPIAVPRNYHSVAVMLPDGTVFSGGGGLCGNGCRCAVVTWLSLHTTACWQTGCSVVQQISTPPCLLGGDCQHMMV